MLDFECVSDTLEALSDARQARKLKKHNRCFRGIRGVAPGEVARIAAATWTEQKPDLERDADALDALFGAAFEDGLVAVALVAACTPQHPEAACELALKWATQTDDPQTADGLGWSILGPALLVAPNLNKSALELLSHQRPWTRRVFVMGAMAGIPKPLEGPAGSCLREVLSQRDIQFVETSMDEWIQSILNASIRDPSAQVRKAIRRVTNGWASVAPESALAWANGVPGGIPKMIRTDLEKSAKRAMRKRQRG